MSRSVRIPLLVLLCVAPAGACGAGAARPTGSDQLVDSHTTSVALLPPVLQVTEPIVVDEATGEPEQPAVVPGGGEANLAGAEIRRVLHQQDGAMRRCYEALLLRVPAVPSGSLTVRIRITPAGAVEQAEVVNGTIEDVEFRRCVEERVRTMTFPLTDQPTVVEAPFGFQAGARGD